MMRYTENYNLKKPEELDPVDIQDLNYNADVIDGKLKEIEDWEAAHLQASNPHNITPALIGAETPAGAQQKANQAETNAKSYADTAADSALSSAKDYANTVANSTLNSAKDYADDILESANNHTDQVASDLSQKLNETRIKVLDVEQDVSNISKVLTSLNPNQEATQSVSGYGILSLPKNAANGQISGIEINGNTVSNIFYLKEKNVVNVSVSEVVVDEEEQSITFTGTGQYKRLEVRNIKVKPNTKYYIKFYSEIISGEDYPSLQVRDNRDNEVLVSLRGIGLLEGEFNTGDYTEIRLNIYATLLTNTTQTKKISKIIISEVNHPYVTGTKSTVSSFRIKSVGKNLLNTSNISNFDIANNSFPTQKNQYILLPKLKVGATYTISLLRSWTANPNSLGMHVDIQGQNPDGSWVWVAGTAIPYDYSAIDMFLYRTFTVDGTKLAYRLVPNNAAAQGSIIRNLQLEEGSQATSYEPYKESSLYIQAKDEEGNIIELHSLPNGVADKIYQGTNGKWYLEKNIGISKDFSECKWSRSQEGHTDNFYSINCTFIELNVDLSGKHLYEVSHKILNYTGNGGTNSEFLPIDDYFYRNNALNALFIKVPKSAYSGEWTLKETQEWFRQNDVKLIYQLAEPVEIPVQVSGTLLSYPSGTVYVENVVADAGLYSDGITVLHQDLPIKSIEKISKIDYETGLETILDASKAVIANDKLSFTHPDLKDGDIVFFTYEYDRESTEGETEIEYYDSRYVIQDSVTGKFYKWKIAVANGTPTIELEEV